MNFLSPADEFVDCEIILKVNRNTVYEAYVGEQLKIACPVQFCNDSTPTITWFKLEKDNSISVNFNNRVKTEWMQTNYDGRSLLIFPNVLSNDSGHYQCRSGDVVSHTIRVNVFSLPNPETEAAAEVEADPQTQSFVLSCVFRLVGLKLFFIVIAGVFVALKKHKNKRVPSDSLHLRTLPQAEPGYDPINPAHIYENDQSSTRV